MGLLNWPNKLIVLLGLGVFVVELLIMSVSEYFNYIFLVNRVIRGLLTSSCSYLFVLNSYIVPGLISSNKLQLDSIRSISNQVLQVNFLMFTLNNQVSDPISSNQVIPVHYPLKRTHPKWTTPTLSLSERCDGLGPRA